MKILISIIFSSLVVLGFAQSDPDSTQSKRLDSLFNPTIITEISPIEFYLSDSTFNFPYYSSSNVSSFIILYQTIPNCSELIKRNGLFYLNNDTASYCGSCVVLYDKENKHVTYKVSDEPKIYFTGSPIWEYDNFVDLNGSKIKIASSYVNGKREGNREYFDLNGNLYKIEVYTNGKLISTIHSNKK